MDRGGGELRLHGFPPVVDGNCRLLILGSMPSVQSLERAQYYGNPRNHFWPMLAMILGEECPRSIAAGWRWLCVMASPSGTALQPVCVRAAWIRTYDRRSPTIYPDCCAAIPSSAQSASMARPPRRPMTSSTPGWMGLATSFYPAPVRRPAGTSAAWRISSPGGERPSRTPFKSKQFNQRIEEYMRKILSNTM